MRKFFGILALGLAGAIAAQSPCFDTNYGTPLGGGDDVVLPLQSIGFAFPFDGVTYADFYASTNGFVYLRNGASALPLNPWCCTITPATLLANPDGPIIAPLWCDLDLTPQNQGQVFVNSSASLCTITWHNAMEFGEPLNTRFHVQLKLYPTGELEFSYTHDTMIRMPFPCIVGVSPGNGASDPGTRDLSLGGTSAAGTLYETFDNAGLPFDLVGQVVALTPTNPQAVGSPIGYGVAPCPQASAPATNEGYGEGCGARFHSVYELFGNPTSFDLAHFSMGMHNVANGFFVNANTAPFVAPSPSALMLALSDDDEVVIGLTTPFSYHGGTSNVLVVCSNGFVSLGGGNGTNYWPVTQEFLDMPDSVFACWHDYNPAMPGSGQVFFEEVGNVAYVTWDGVYSLATTTPDTFQFQFELNTGTVRLVWGSMGATGTPYLVGYSPGGVSMDPGNIDLSHELPFTFFVPAGAENPPLGLTATGLAYPGGTVALNAIEIPANSPFAAILLGLTRHDPGLELSSLGMPGCLQFNDAVAVTLFFPPLTGTLFHAPSGTAFLGVRIQAQAAAYAPGTTPLGFISSNGVEMTLGT